MIMNVWRDFIHEDPNHDFETIYRLHCRNLDLPSKHILQWRYNPAMKHRIKTICFIRNNIFVRFYPSLSPLRSDGYPSSNNIIIITYDKCKIYKLRLHILNNGGQKIFISFLLCVWSAQIYSSRLDQFFNRKVFSFNIYFGMRDARPAETVAP